MRIWNACLKCAARGSLKIQDAKNRHFCTSPQFCRAISSELRHISTFRKKLVKQHNPSTCPDNMVNFGLLTAEICWRVCGTSANVNGFHVLEALMHGTIVVGVSWTLQHWTEGATYIRQNGHHVGHWPIFLVPSVLPWKILRDHWSGVFYWKDTVLDAKQTVAKLWSKRVIVSVKKLHFSMKFTQCCKYVYFLLWLIRCLSSW